MKLMIIVLLLLPALFFTQDSEAKTSRVIEMENEISSEVSVYFERRLPGEPFAVKVEILPLRRTLEAGGNSEILPYGTESDEMTDEWDNPEIPSAHLRNRITRMSVLISVSNHFDDQELADIQKELSSHLRLLPMRDDLKIEKSIKSKAIVVPVYIYIVLAGIILSAVILAGVIRWSAGKVKSESDSRTSSASRDNSFRSDAPLRNDNKHGSTEVNGDITFNDPVKTLDLAHLKIEQIKDSGTFPTLKDMIALNELCIISPSKLGSIIFELPKNWQDKVYANAKDEKWLEAFCSCERIDSNTLNVLESMARERVYCNGNRNLEDLLILVWRMEDKAISFLKKIDQGHAFYLLKHLPKSVSLKIAKKAYPGSWASILNKDGQEEPSEKLVGDYLEEALKVVPTLGPGLLAEYKQNKEMIEYLDQAGIDDERDIYETIEPSSLIHSMRPAFYKVFELAQDQFKKMVETFPIETWAIVVMNSNRKYSKQIMEVLEDKKKVVFTGFLKKFDSPEFSTLNQSQLKRKIASHLLSIVDVIPNSDGEELEK